MSCLSYPATLNLPAHFVGTLWPRVEFEPIVVDADYNPGNLDRVRWTFSHVNGEDVYRLESDAGEDHDAILTIEDAATWNVVAEENENFLTVPGEWTFRVAYWTGGASAPLVIYQGILTVIA